MQPLVFFFTDIDVHSLLKQRINQTQATPLDSEHRGPMVLLLDTVLPLRRHQPTLRVPVRMSLHPLVKRKFLEASV
jgi:hypothetical protein